MKVLDLQCPHQHVFEGWFGSEDDFQHQLSRGLVACPMCGDVKITKKLSAPRLNLNTSRGERDAAPQAVTPEAATPSEAIVPNAAPPSPTPEEAAKLAPAELQAALLKMVRHVVAHTEDVGDSFPEEARKIHYGEAEQRSIRGHATAEETEELIDEGIVVMPLPLADAVKDPLQ